MGELFKGWRWKGGLITLAMALALNGMWLRSYVTADFFKFGLFGQQHIAISIEGQAAWESYPRYGAFHYEWRKTRGLGLGTIRQVSDQMTCKVPYWSLVLPLTLLSAWLILGKRPKAKTPPPPTI